MKTILNLLFFGLFIFINTAIYSQDRYAITWGQSTYDTLTNFESILEEKSPEYRYSIFKMTQLQVDFNFEFPYFDNIYTNFILDANGFGRLPDNNTGNFNFYLFGSSYENLGILDSIYLSDVRVINEKIDDIDVLKIEWNNIGSYFAVEEDFIPKHSMNFQVWFYNNGIIEYHFGKFDLDSSNYYNPHEGFIFANEFRVGPTIGIGNNDQTESYFLSGYYDTPSVDINLFQNSVNPYLGVPTEGWFVRFTPSDLVSTNTNITDPSEFIIYPTLADNVVNWKFEEGNLSKKVISIVDLSGKIISNFETHESSGIIDVSNYSDGMYILQTTMDNNRLNNKKIIITKN